MVACKTAGNNCDDYEVQSYAAFAHPLPRFGIEVRFIDPAKPASLAELVEDKTKLAFGARIGIEHIDDLLADLKQSLA